MAGLRLPRQARLLQRTDFAALRAGSQRVSARAFVAEFRCTSAASARLGMAVSRRVSKLAVVRNRIRRVARESYRLHRATLPPVDVLLIARVQAADSANAQLRADLETIWRKLISHCSPPLKGNHEPGTMRTGQ